MPTLTDIDGAVGQFLKFLDQAVYKSEREQIGDTVYYKVSKNGSYMGMIGIRAPCEANFWRWQCGSFQFAKEHEKAWYNLVYGMMIPALECQFGPSATWENQPTSAALPEPPVKPKEPPAGSDKNAWFDYYHTMLKAGYKITLGDIAEKSGWSENTLKPAHQRYKAERGIT